MKFLFSLSVLLCFPTFKRLRFYLVLEQVTNRTRQKTLWKPPSSPCVPLRYLTWNIPRQGGTKERGRLLSSLKQTPLILKGEKGDFTPTRATPMKPFPDRACKEPWELWLQDNEIFGQDKECSQDDIWVMIKVCFYIDYVFIFSSWDVPSAEGR